MAGCIVRQLLFCTFFIHVTQVTIIKDYLLTYLLTYLLLFEENSKICREITEI